MGYQEIEGPLKKKPWRWFRGNGILPRYCIDDSSRFELGWKPPPQ